MAIRETRLANLIQLESRYKLRKDFASAIDLSPSFTSQILEGHKPIGNQTARKIEKMLHLEEGFLDLAHETAKPSDIGAEVMSAAYAIDSFPLGVRTAFLRLIMAVSAAGITRPEEIQAPQARLMATPFERTYDAAAVPEKPAIIGDGSVSKEGRRRSR